MFSIFKLIAFDEGEVRGAPNRLRLVCNIEGGGKLAIWGKKGSRENINIVLNAGLPCEIVCKTQKPNLVQARKFGHTHWVSENSLLRVLVSA